MLNPIIFVIKFEISRLTNTFIYSQIFMDYLKNCEIIAEQEDLVCSKSDCHKVIEAWILRYNYTFIIFLFSLAEVIIASQDKFF